jgi:hypothetical protein
MVRRFTAAPLHSSEVISALRTITGQTLTEGYRLTETSPVTHSTPFLAKRKPGSMAYRSPAPMPHR